MPVFRMQFPIVWGEFGKDRDRRIVPVAATHSPTGWVWKPAPGAKSLSDIVGRD